MINIVLFGAPGCGKGTQAQRLKAHYGIEHVSTGEVIRDEIRRGTELGRSMESYIKAGKLAPDEIVIGMEAHAELLTQTKQFCNCANVALAPPNTNVCPVCLGFPGSLPVLNADTLEERGMRGQGSERTFPMLLQLDDRRGVEH